MNWVRAGVVGLVGLEVFLIPEISRVGAMHVIQLFVVQMLAFFLIYLPVDLGHLSILLSVVVMYSLSCHHDIPSPRPYHEINISTTGRHSPSHSTV